MIDKFLRNVLVVVPVCIALILWWAVSLKCGLLFYGIFSMGMYLHITVTTMSNAFMGRDINVDGDLFWKTCFLIISCLCLSIFFVG